MTVPCPFNDCNYSTNMYSSFNAHKSRTHEGILNFCDAVVSEKDVSLDISTDVLEDEDPTHCYHADMSAFSKSDSFSDTSQLRAQLHHNLSSLFLKMQTVHVSDIAAQEIVDHLSQIFSLSQPLVKDAIQEVLQRHHVCPTDAIVNDLVTAVMDSNIFVSATAKGEELSTTKRRKTLIEREYPVVMPVQHVLDPGCTMVYVPVLQMIQSIFKHTDVLERMEEIKGSDEDHYMSHKDGTYFQNNDLFSSTERCHCHSSCTLMILKLQIH